MLCILFAHYFHISPLWHLSFRSDGHSPSSVTTLHMGGGCGIRMALKTSAMLLIKSSPTLCIRFIIYIWSHFFFLEMTLRHKTVMGDSGWNPTFLVASATPPHRQGHRYRVRQNCFGILFMTFTSWLTSSLYCHTDIWFHCMKDGANKSPERLLQD